MSTNTTDSLPLVSVITVCYNLVKNGRADYFQECVASVHRQTYQNIEHIIIDGGSQDGTRELLETYAAKGWLRFVSESDDGIYDAMNKGIQTAKGKYIAFLNSDDYWHSPQGVEASVKELEKTGAAFSYAARNRVTEAGKFLFREEASIGTFIFLMPFCHQTMFTRRDILLKYNGFDQQHYRSSADYDLIMRLILGGEKCVYVPHNFTTFRSGGFSETPGGGNTKDETYLVRQALLGTDAADMINNGYLNDEIMQRVLPIVDAGVALDMLRCLKQDGPGCYTIIHGLVTSKKPGIYSAGFTKRERISWKLFNALPILTAKIRNKRIDYSLFGFFPLLRVKKDNNKRTDFLLFWAIPLISVRLK